MNESRRERRIKVAWRVAKLYLFTALTITLTILFVRTARAAFIVLDFVFKQPESFFTNKMMFTLLLMVGGFAVFFWGMGTVLINTGTAAINAFQDVFKKKWRCAYGAERCEVGKKGIEEPLTFCVPHYKERTKKVRR